MHARASNAGSARMTPSMHRIATRGAPEPSPSRSHGGEGWVRGALRPSVLADARSKAPLTPALSPDDRAVGGEGVKRDAFNPLPLHPCTHVRATPGVRA